MNKIEKFLSDNYINSIITKKKGNGWILEDKENIFLGKTIDEAINKLKEIYPEDKIHKRRLLLYFDRKTFCPEPTILFEEGEQVIVGNLKDCVIDEVLFNGKAYFVNSKSGMNIWPWHDIEKMSSKETPSLWIKDDDNIFVNYSSMSINSLITDVFYFGVDFNPDYQRGNVWDLNDKIALMDSIFNDCEIGRFCLNKLPFKHKSPSYEIVDGKQRLTAIIEFVTNKFQYKNMYWWQLNPRDKDKFCGKAVQISEINTRDKKTIYKYFLKMNTGGRVQDQSHIEYVRELLKREESNS